MSADNNAFLKEHMISLMKGQTARIPLISFDNAEREKPGISGQQKIQIFFSVYRAEEKS